MSLRYPRSLGERILALREVKRLTLPDLASRSGVSAAAINRYELDPNSNYRRASVDLLAGALEVDVAYLLGVAPPDVLRIPTRRIASRHSLERFLEAGSFTKTQRDRFHRIEDHAAAPVTVQQWRDFWALLRGFFGRGPIALGEPRDPRDDAPLLRRARRDMLHATLMPVEADVAGAEGTNG